MISLEVHPARTYFTSDSERKLEKMFRCLRIKTKDKSSFWRARLMLRRAKYIYRLPEKEQRREREKIIAKSKYINFYNRRSDSFASGLLPYVKKYLKRKRIRYEVHDLRERVPTNGDKFVKIQFQDKLEIREEQTRAIKAALDSGRGILACATNSGKTDVASAIIYEFWKQTGKVPRVLFVVHRTGVVKQSMERFQRHLEHKTFPITMIGGGNKEVPVNGILAATTQTAASLIENKDFKFIDFLEKTDLLIFDEFHVNKSNQASLIAERCRATMRFGLSGTIDEENELKMMHYTGLCGPVIARISNQELVEKGRSAKPHIRFVEVKSDYIPIGKGYAHAYKEGITYNKERNRKIVKEAIRYVRKGLPTLITVGRISHGIVLQDKLKKKIDVPVEYISGSTPMPFREGVIKEFEAGKVAVLIASPIFDVGMDVPVIGAWINAGGGLGWELVLQRLGRVLRKKSGENRVLITDFVDKHSKHLMRHSLARFKHYVREQIATFEFK